MSYSAENIRNICLLGHSGVGKTMLAESMLYLTGATDRLGKTADGNTVCDYDPEEIKRQITIATALAPVEFGGCKINVLDTPGNFDFNGDVLAALQVADAAVIVLPAKGDISVGAERAYKEIKARNLPCLIYVSKTDEEQWRLQRCRGKAAGKVRQRRHSAGHPQVRRGKGRRRHRRGGQEGLHHEQEQDRGRRRPR